jgi:aminopeptidase N
MEHYVLYDNKEKAKKHFQQVKPILQFFETKFGPYPWYEDGFKFVESPYEGMEHQSGIAYGSRYRNIGGFDLDYIILHEAAHEWWGNSVSVSDFADIWLQEGFATYCEALYVEDRDDHQRYLSYILFERLFIKNKRPVVGMRDRRYFDYKDTDVYMKGAWILHSLRSVMANDSLFFDILKSFRMEYHGRLVTSRDFIQWVNTQSGTDYNWFFDHYLFQREAPILEYYIDWWGDNVILYYRWKNTGKSFKMPCAVTYVNAKGQISKAEITPTHQLQTMKFSGGVSPKSAYRFDVLQKYYGIEENKKLKKLKVITEK